MDANYDDDDDIVTEVPKSARALIEDLDIGQTYSKAHRFDANVTEKSVPRDVLRLMRQNIQATVHRISLRTGQRFTIETVEAVTHSRDILAIVAVTRTD